MRKKDGYRNQTELSQSEIEYILSAYLHSHLTTKQISEMFKLTRRSLGVILTDNKIQHRHRKNRYQLRDDYFSVIDTEDKAYHLGILFADGYVGDEHFNNVVLSQKQDDSEIVHRFATALHFTGNIRTAKCRGGYQGQVQCVLNFSSEQMVKDLFSLGCCHLKSNRLHLPDISETLMPHFCRGLFDADGCISRTVKYIRKDQTPYYNVVCCFCGRSQLLEELRIVLPVDTMLYNATKSSEVMYLYNKFRGELPKLFHYLYDDATTFLQRKYDTWCQVLGDIGE